MKHLGDITKINGAEIEPVDVITGGSPCQDYAEEQAPTLNAECGGNKPAVMAFDMTHACDVIRECGEIAPSLQARMGTGGNQVPLTYQMQGFGDYREGDVASSCKQRDFKDSTDLVCSAVDCRNFTESGEINGTLQARESGGQSLNLQNTVRQNMVVRRLTPLECERCNGRGSARWASEIEEFPMQVTKLRFGEE